MDPARQFLQQRAQWGDPYSGTYQRDAIRSARVAGERPVGSLEGDAGAGLEKTNCAALVAERLDSHPDIGRPRQCGQRVWVCLPPEVSGEEAPEENLAPRPSGSAGGPRQLWRQLYADIPAAVRRCLVARPGGIVEITSAH